MASATLSVITTPAINPARTVAAGLFTASPVTERRAVSATSGTSANGMPKDSTTYESTRALVGSAPRHHRRAEHAGREQHAVDAVEAWRQTMQKAGRRRARSAGQA
jgi:hypothetical protein